MYYSKKSPLTPKKSVFYTNFHEKMGISGQKEQFLSAVMVKFLPARTTYGIRGKSS